MTEEGVLDLIVGSQTTVTVELVHPVSFTQPLGSRGTAKTIRFHADDPETVVRALRTAATGERHQQLLHRTHQRVASD